MIEPVRPSLIIACAAAADAKNAPRKFTSITASNCAGSVSIAGEWRAIPALFTKMSRGLISMMAAFIASISLISATIPSAVNPAVIMAEMTSSSMSLRLAMMMTQAPASAKATAQPSPIPDVPPITRARRPASENDGVLGSSVIVRPRRLMRAGSPAWTARHQTEWRPCCGPC